MKMTNHNFVWCVALGVSSAFLERAWGLDDRPIVSERMTTSILFVAVFLLGVLRRDRA